ITSPRPPQTTVQPRSASSRPTASARSSCSVPLPITDTCIAVQLGWRDVRRSRAGRALVACLALVATGVAAGSAAGGGGPNGPSCSAGFSHGLIMALGPQIVRMGPVGAAAACRKASTRYQRYSCVHGLGHAYMRLFDETVAPSIAACRALGPADAADCAQGAFHDYWIAIAGLDQTRRPVNSTTSPRKLCGAQHGEFVRSCWYRAFLERPPKRFPASGRDLLALCRGLDGIQHESCVTAASLVVSPDPFDQLAV